MTMAQLDQLPREVIQTTCSYIHPSTIVAFASTCKILYIQSTRALARHRHCLQKYYEVDDRSAKNIPVVLLDVLRQPWLVWYIKRLVIYTHRDYWSDWETVYNSDGSRKYRLVRSIDDGNLLRRLHRLDEIAQYQSIFRTAFNVDQCLLDPWIIGLSRYFYPKDILLLRTAIEEDPECGRNPNKWIRSIARGDDFIYRILLISIASGSVQLDISKRICLDQNCACWRCEKLIDLARP